MKMRAPSKIPIFVAFAGRAHMAKVALKLARYVKIYGALALGARPRTIEEAIDCCADSPNLNSQVRSEIVRLGKLLQELAPDAAGKSRPTTEERRFC
jgi:hypothetical protein